MNAIFTRHQLTAQQLAEIGTASASEDGLVKVWDLAFLAKENLDTQEDIDRVYQQLCLICKGKHYRIYGVIPAPLRAKMLADDNLSHGCGGAGWTVEIWEAWNVQRSVEGQKPTFEHRGWLKTGVYELQRIQ